MIKSIQDLYEIFEDRRTILFEFHFIRSFVRKHAMKFDISLAKHVKPPPCKMIVNNNSRYNIYGEKCSFFYALLKQSTTERNPMELIWSNKFKFPKSAKIWKSIYKQKIQLMVDNKLREFNFKLLNNIVPSGYILAKWEKTIKPTCDFCRENETTEHMLFTCSRISQIWDKIFQSLGTEAKWKFVMCGFIQREESKKIEFLNLIVSKIVYSIFRLNSKCKSDLVSYKDQDVESSVKMNLVHLMESLKISKHGLYSSGILKKCIASL